MKKYKFFAFDLINGDHDFFETQEEAKVAAEKFLAYYKDNASQDGWPEDISFSIGWGEIKEVVGEEKIIAEKKNFTDEEWEEEGYSSDWDKIVNFELEPIK